MQCTELQSTLEQCACSSILKKTSFILPEPPTGVCGITSQLPTQKLLVMILSSATSGGISSWWTMWSGVAENEHWETLVNEGGKLEATSPKPQLYPVVSSWILFFSLLLKSRVARPFFTSPDQVSRAHPCLEVSHTRTRKISFGFFIPRFRTRPAQQTYTSFQTVHEIFFFKIF